MNRQSFIRRLSLGTGATVLLPASGLFQGCSHTPVTRSSLGTADIPLLGAIAEAILPETKSSPGARAAGVGAYMVLMFTDCMAAEEQALFLGGINEIDARAAGSFSTSFEDMAPADQLALMESLQGEAIAHKETLEAQAGTTDARVTAGGSNHTGVAEPGEEPLPHFFELIKGLVISGYFSSEPGMTQARAYLPVPGAYHGCIPYGGEDKPWAT